MAERDCRFAKIAIRNAKEFPDLEASCPYGDCRAVFSYRDISGRRHKDIRQIGPARCTLAVQEFFQNKRYLKRKKGVMGKEEFNVMRLRSLDRIELLRHELKFMGVKPPEVSDTAK